MLLQQRRIKEAREFKQAWDAPFRAMRKRRRKNQGDSETEEETLCPLESWCENKEDLIDPLGIERLRHDIAPGAFEALLAEQAPKLRAILTLPETQYNQAEQIKAGGGVVKIVNKVCTVYTQPLGPDEHSLDVDEESEYAQKAMTPEETRRAKRGHCHREAILNQLTAQWEDPVLEEQEVITPLSSKRLKGQGTASKYQHPPSHLSLRWLQRRWILIGYNKNSVGNALSIRYAQPWASTHLAFTTARVFSTGANNRPNDRGLVKYATVPYLHRPLNVAGVCKPGRRFGAIRRISQNIVACQHLVPHGKALCLGLILKQLEGQDASVPKNFKSVVLLHPDRRATMLIYRTKTVCVGTSSFDNLAATYDYFQPLLERCINTPENLAAEAELVRRGAIDKDTAQRAFNYVVTLGPDGKPSKVERVDPVTGDVMPTQEQQQQPPQKRGKKRKRNEEEELRVATRIIDNEEQGPTLSSLNLDSLWD